MVIMSHFLQPTPPAWASTTANASSGPFDVDPFGQQNAQTPTDPFGGSDPFGDDPFKSATTGNPFQMGSDWNAKKS